MLSLLAEMMHRYFMKHMDSISQVQPHCIKSMQQLTHLYQRTTGPKFLHYKIYNHSCYTVHLLKVVGINLVRNR